MPSLERLQLTLEGGDLVELLVELGEPLGHGRRRQAPLERTVTLLVTENNATLIKSDKLVYYFTFLFTVQKWVEKAQFSNNFFKHILFSYILQILLVVILIQSQYLGSGLPIHILRFVPSLVSPYCQLACCAPPSWPCTPPTWSAESTTRPRPDRTPSSIAVLE